ncbi:PLP-dependent aminotransferase family protein [Paenibacillus tarimensis]
MIEIMPLLDKKDRSPLYAQLYNYIKERIESGSIPQGSKLPPIRQLSLYLKISKNTVEAAYQQLFAEGYIESERRIGLRVLPLEEVGLKSPSNRSVSPKKHDEESFRYDFRYGDVDTIRFPMNIWKKCLSDSLSRDPQQIFGYGHPQGSPELREELADYLFQSRGVTCHADQIYICAGTQHAVSAAVRLLGLRGQNVAMEDPGYNGVRTVFRNEGCTLLPVSVGHDGLNADELVSMPDVRAVYVTPSHQFPLGMVLSVQKRMRLLQWAARHEAFIIEDDYDSEFRYLGQPIPSLKALDSKERVIYLGTLSKSFLPAARLSYMVLPVTMKAELEEMFSVYSNPVSPIIQQAVFLFMSRGHFSRHIRKMRRLYQAKHKTLMNAIQQYMGDRVTIIGHKSGLHILLDVKQGGGGQLIDQAAQSGVKVYTPHIYWMDQGQCPSSYVMLGFGGLSEEEIEDGVRMLSEVWFDNAAQSGISTSEDVSDG